jgi:hypothetical protein
MRLLARRGGATSSISSTSPAKHFRFVATAAPSSPPAAPASAVVKRHSPRSHDGSSGSSSSSVMSSSPAGTKNAMMMPLDAQLQCAQSSPAPHGWQKPPCMV